MLRYKMGIQENIISKVAQEENYDAVSKACAKEGITFEDTIWAYEYRSDIRTVDVHIRRLREKIERVPSQPEYIFTKWGVGYYFTDKD